MIREISIDEEDLVLLNEAIDRYVRQLKANAARTKSGYGTVSSQMKRDAYMNKIDEYEDLQARLCELYLMFLNFKLSPFNFQLNYGTKHNARPTEPPL